MPWNSVEEIEPPKDRVIEVTSGGAWVYEDRYADLGDRRRPNTTHRNWKFQGGVMLVLWYEADQLATKTGHWIDTLSGGIMQPFKYWREYENPLQGSNTYLTSTTPPYPIHQDFQGDARLRIYDQIEGKVRKEIAWAENIIQREEAEGRQPTPSVIRALGLYQERLAKVIEDRIQAFDPYDLPIDVRGTNKSD